MRSRVALNIPSETRPAPHHPVPSTAATNQSNEPRDVPHTATEAAQLDGTRCGAERGEVRRSSQGTGGDAPQEPVAGSTQWHWVTFRPRHLPYGSSVQRQVRPAFAFARCRLCFWYGSVGVRVPVRVEGWVWVTPNLPGQGQGRRFPSTGAVVGRFSCWRIG